MSMVVGVMIVVGCVCEVLMMGVRFFDGSDLLWSIFFVGFVLFWYNVLVIGISSVGCVVKFGYSGVRV